MSKQTRRYRTGSGGDRVKDSTVLIAKGSTRIRIQSALPAIHELERPDRVANAPGFVTSSPTGQRSISATRVNVHPIARTCLQDFCGRGVLGGNLQKPRTAEEGEQ